METPSSLGYRMPAEWESHKATWLAWPKNPETFPSEIIGAVERTFVKIIEGLAPGEEVWLLVDDEKTEKRVRGMLKSDKNVLFHRQRTADVWVRDYAPIYLRGRDVALAKWEFNSWGNKYDDLLPDNETGTALAESSNSRAFKPGIVLEGGSVDVNGRGTLLTTEQCLLNKNRNPGHTKRAIEWRLRAHFGVSHIVWLGSGIAGDDTDGHVDDIARFVTPDALVVAWEEKEADPNAQPLKENFRRLRNSVDQDGEIFDIVTIPMPPPITSPYGRLPASHLNFYIGNAAVLVPTFGSRSDSNALGTLKSYFSDRDVIGIDCRALVYGLGTIHCATQQVPAMGARVTERKKPSPSAGRRTPPP
jgi:agmatine deiminase